MGIARHRTWLLAGSAVAVWIGLSAGSAFAQQATAQTNGDGETVELETVEVTGGGGSGTGDVSPAVTAKEGTAMLTTTTREELNDRMIQSWQELSQRAEPSLNFSNQNNSINVRGLGENMVQTTIDGIRLPFLGVGDARGVEGGLSTFDFNALTTIDIVRGADSSIAGGGAMGGLVALTTLSADDLLTEGRKYGFLTKNGYRSADDSWFTSNAAAARVGDTAMLVQGSYSSGHEMKNMGDVGGYGPDRTEPNPEDWDQYSILGKLSHRVDGGHEFTLAGEVFHAASTIDVMTAQSEAGTYRPGDNWGGETADRQRVSLTWDFDAPDTNQWVDKAQAIVYWQNVERGDTTTAYRSARPLGWYLRDNSNQVQEYGLTGFGEKEVQLGGYANKFTFGGEIYLTDTKQFSWGEDGCEDDPTAFSCRMLHSNQADSPNANGTTIGIYARDEIAVWQNVTVTPGIRFDWYEQVPQATAGYEDDNPIFIGLPDTSTGHKFSPSLLATWKAREDLSFYAQWAQSFVAPTPAQLYLTYGGPGAYIALGNPDLEAQSGTGYETGVKYGDAKLGGAFAAFTNFYKNFITTETLDKPEIIARGYEPADYPFGVTEYVNLDSVNIYGVEARGNWEFRENWKVWGSAAWMVGQDLENNTFIDSVPPLKGVIGIGYSTPEWGTDLMLTAAAVHAQTTWTVDNPDFDPTVPVSRDNSPQLEPFYAPAYATVDWTVWWQPEKIKGLRVQAGVFNIFDETYWNYLDIPATTLSTASNTEFYSMPGRNYQVNLTYQF